MVHRGLVLVAIACSALIVASFSMFARDKVSGASSHQVQALVGPGTPTTPAPTRHAQPRRFIDSAAKTLTSPFSSVLSSNDSWVSHGIPTLLALAFYGLGIGYLARFTRGMT